MAAARRIAMRGSVVAATVGLALTMDAGESMAKSFNLSISGDSGSRFRGACTLAAASGDRRIELEGTVPLQRTLEGDGLTCRFDAQGRIVVEIAHDGSRSVAASSGGTIQVSAR